VSIIALRPHYFILLYHTHDVSSASFWPTMHGDESYHHCLNTSTGPILMAIPSVNDRRYIHAVTKQAGRHIKYQETIANSSWVPILDMCTVLFDLTLTFNFSHLLRPQSWCHHHSLSVVGKKATQLHSAY
jgi:hypothetical protein